MNLLDSHQIEIPWQIAVLVSGLIVLFVALALIAVLIDRVMDRYEVKAKDRKVFSYIWFWPYGVIKFLREYVSGKIIRCPNCGKENRSNYLRYTNGKCVACKTDLSGMEGETSDVQDKARGIKICYVLAWFGVALLLVFVGLLISEI